MRTLREGRGIGKGWHFGHLTVLVDTRLHSVGRTRKVNLESLNFLGVDWDNVYD